MKITILTLLLFASVATWGQNNPSTYAYYQSHVAQLRYLGDSTTFVLDSDKVNITDQFIQIGTKKYTISYAGIPISDNQFWWQAFTLNDTLQCLVQRNGCYGLMCITVLEDDPKIYYIR